MQQHCVWYVGATTRLHIDATTARDLGRSSMDESAATPEQQQLHVEIAAVVASIGKSDDASKTSYEIEQGRKLIAKATSLGLPRQSYADLQRLIGDHDTKSSGR